ncbi:MAG: hypothetical protein Q8N03_18100 [Ignavibacteria bacterium]|nr:hypothetical protein [Ignavibacteria bacterium]
MIPSFTKEGLLPQGIFPAKWEELKLRFGTNQHRINLLEGLKKALINLKAAGCSVVYIDGSFVTDKHYPSDIDCCYSTDGINWNAMDSVFKDFSNKRMAQKLKYSCEFFPSSSLADANGNTYFEFFQIDKSSNFQKGIIELGLVRINDD